MKEYLERGMSYTDIAQMLGRHRLTMKALSERESNYVKKRTKKVSKLDPYKEFLLKRVLKDHVINWGKLYQEIRKQGYSGCRTTLKEFVQPYRTSFKESHTSWYETEPGEQMQVDWKEAGLYRVDGDIIPLMIFVATLSYSRMSYVCFAERQDREHLLHHYEFTPELHRPYRSQTNGKVEGFIGYMNDWLETSSVRSSQELIRTLMRWGEEKAMKESLNILPTRYEVSFLTY